MKVLDVVSHCAKHYSVFEKGTDKDNMIEKQLLIDICHLLLLNAVSILKLNKSNEFFKGYRLNEGECFFVVGLYHNLLIDRFGKIVLDVRIKKEPNANILLVSNILEHFSRHFFAFDYI